MNGVEEHKEAMGPLVTEYRSERRCPIQIGCLRWPEVKILYGVYSPCS